ncbi:MAG: exosortase system-associated protein, TIGR04073 family [Candidatus Omnitrophota bacterium]|nr:exosortase system-associated protein, TIGR04073 family [Candidatus Omnitrophota bacterium]
MVLASALLAISLARPAFAEDFGGNPGTKLTRGIVNLTTGWLEIPAQMAEQKETDPTHVMWFFHGLLQGMTVGGSRTLYGLWDIVTFPVAPYNAPFMEPDTLINPKAKPRE